MALLERDEERIELGEGEEGRGGEKDMLGGWADCGGNEGGGYERGGVERGEEVEKDLRRERRERCWLPLTHRKGWEIGVLLGKTIAPPVVVVRVNQRARVRLAIGLVQFQNQKDPYPLSRCQNSSKRKVSETLVDS